MGEMEIKQDEVGFVLLRKAIAVSASSAIAMTR
jgi:hypothetical protein